MQFLDESIWASFPWLQNWDREAAGMRIVIQYMVVNGFHISGTTFKIEMVITERWACVCVWTHQCDSRVQIGIDYFSAFKSPNAWC